VSNTRALHQARIGRARISARFFADSYTRFVSGAFFNFNGTAGLWRRECIEKSGGWNNRTTVEVRFLTA
jgi:beta-mannan synthase